MRKEVKKMKEILMYMRRKLQQEKGEVSVEWALVAVIMAGAILAVFSPGITDALTTAMGVISAALTGA
jgi:Flp pilus assembly pilin Flp